MKTDKEKIEYWLDKFIKVSKKERLYKKAFKEACSLLILDSDRFASQQSAEQSILRLFKKKDLLKR